MSSLSDRSDFPPLTFNSGVARTRLGCETSPDELKSPEAAVEGPIQPILVTNPGGPHFRVWAPIHFSFENSWHDYLNEEVIMPTKQSTSLGR
jgi:hypothetical protein